MGRNKWTDKQLIDIYNLKEEGKSYDEIGKIIGKTREAVRRKYKRVPWKSFLSDPESYKEKDVAGKWNQAEMGQLYAFLQMDLSYEEIAESLGRSIISVERKAQTTDWKAWKTAVGALGDNHPETVNEELLLASQLVDALVLLSRRDQDRLTRISEKEFKRKINFEGEKLPLSFSDIKKKAKAHFEEMGLENPEELKFNEGTYLIVGDSHGKFTKTAMFELLQQVVKTLKVNHIFHLGHILDDDNDISYNWGNFKNLTVLAKTEELHLIQDQRNKFKFNFDVVRGCVNLGNDLTVMNQDLITDYVKTPLSSLDSEIFDDKVIVNCHRQEIMPKTNYDGYSYFASPGSLCEKHIIRTIKQIDFEQDRTVKVAYHSGFSKYRRMRHLYKYWKQGMIIVNVDKQGKHTVVPCIIRKVKHEYATSYFDKIITSSGLKVPDKKIVVVGDIHSPSHDGKALDIQEQICKDYKPDILVNVGDTHDYKSINHHDLDKGNVVTKNVIEESATTHHVCKRMATWAKESHILYGNHERFADDFIAKFPQFRQILDLKFLCNLEDLGYNIVEMKDVLKLGPTSFIHGDLRMYGQSGSAHEKASRTFGENTYFGHIHYCGIRFGALSVGLTGLLDQGYNEKNASRWVHGIGLCNHFGGKSFPTSIPIENYRCIIGKKSYTPKKPAVWTPKDYSAKLVYP